MTRSRLPWLSCGLLAACLIGVEASSPLGSAAIALVLLTALRLLESARVMAPRSARRQVALLQLISAGLLAGLRPELAPSLLLLAATVTALAGLLAEAVSAGASSRQLLGRSFTLLSAALPMALVVFLLVPRLGPLLPGSLSRPRTALTGLAEELEPGSIADLARSNAPAARVSWQSGAPPSSGSRYWRVLVHRHFDGRRWLHRRDPTSSGNATFNAAVNTGPAGPGRQFWLVEGNGLSAVPWDGSGLPEGATLRQAEGGELHDRRPPDQRRSYQVQAALPPPAWQRQPPTAADLALPAGQHPRLAALAARWRRQGTPRQRLELAEAWFRARPFRYTTSPGPLPPQDGLDVFLFDRQQGFCGHYASAFTALMRAAGVPARVVSGYLGGTWVQPLGGEAYLDLRQGDAHAWSEVWLPQRGWLRVDPTGWVAPERRQVMPLAELQDRSSSWLWLQRQWWGLDLAWSRWWQGFDRQGQEELLRRLFGDRRPWQGLLVLGGVLLTLIGGLLALQRRPPPQERDPARQELERVLQLLRQAGIAAQPGDSLTDLTERTRRLRPELASSLHAFIADYRQLRFSPRPASDLRPLRLQRWRLQQQLRIQQQLRMQQASAPRQERH